MTITNIAALVRALAEAGVEFIIAGGVAANLQGSARTTVDLDVVYRRTDENMARLVAALGPLQPYLRGAPEGLPFIFDLPTLQRGLNFTLTTRSGRDRSARRDCRRRHLRRLRLRERCLVHRGGPIRCLSLRRLIATKLGGRRIRTWHFELLAARAARMP